MRPSKTSTAFAAAIALSLTSCGGSSRSTLPPATADPVTTPIGGTADLPSPATSAASSSSSPNTRADSQTSVASAGTAGETLVSSVGPSIAVSGGVLPSGITDAYRTGGGEMAATTDWTARYDTYGLPVVTGTNVALVAATASTRPEGAGLQRDDELQWLFLDDNPGGSKGVLDDLATAAHLDGPDWSVEEHPSTVNGASCVERDYTATVSLTTWALSSCSYPRFVGMYSAGVVRKGTFTGTQPPAIEPTLNGVLDTLHGTLGEVTVSFARPVTVGSVSTLHTHADITWNGTVETAAVALLGGPLAGWTKQPGDNSARFAGVTGNGWILGPTTVAFDGEGRLTA